ncbi:hypothetical protein WBP06_00815 [Novosphingobium sp. BL-8H]|uniref:hypothetical protein n=1 Tax=Novosphingobium sp. BL-8H TaxID=3127640 RepID=UPI00375838F5
MIGTTLGRVPRHLWLVGIVALLWNAFGCLDFSMTVTRNPDWLAPLSPQAIDWLDETPGWAVMAWGMGVGGGLLGALLLLLRSRWAIAAFTLSLLGLAGSQVYQFMVPMPGAASGGNFVLTAAIWIVALFLLGYAIRMRGRRVLR